MKITVYATDYFRENVVSIESDVGEDLPTAIIATSEMFGKAWTNHFAGSARHAAIMAAFAIGIRLEKGSEEPVQYFGHDIIVRVEQ